MEKRMDRGLTFEDIFAVMSAAASGDEAARVDLSKGASPNDPAARMGAELNRMLDAVQRRMDDCTGRLRQSETKFAKAFKASPAAISIASLPDGRWLEVNDALGKLIGYTPEESLGKTSTELGIVDAAARAKILEAIREHGMVRNVELEMRTKSGESRIVLVSVEQVEIDGRPCALTIQYDITELKQALREVNRLNQDLRRGRTALEEANKELESFSYSVAHDLRAPLRSINGFSNMILESQAGRLDAEGTKYLHYVCHSAQHMGNLIDDLLALAQVTRSDMRRGRVDLSALARSVIDRLGKSSPERKVEILIADNLVAQGDSRLLSVALENLIGNAWKFTSKEPSARIEFGAGEKDGSPVYFVRDNGVGFDMDYAGKLFGVFQRLHPTEEFEGTGIGLATVRRVLSRHGGSVWAEAKVGEGATFHFTLGGEKNGP
jgi:PAS domain S-box-containing protein